MKKNFLFLMVFYYIFIIFSFSMQPATSSAAESRGLVEFIYELIFTKLKIFPSLSKAEFVVEIVPIARKLAHFGNFFILSVITFMYVSCYKKNILMTCGYVLLLCLFVAVTDEFLQMFSQGRACRMFDVIIDFSGASLSVSAFSIYRSFFVKNDLSGGSCCE